MSSKTTAKKSGRAITSPLFLVSVLGFGSYLGWSMVGASPSLLSPGNAHAIEQTAIEGPFERIAWLLAILLYALYAMHRQRAKTPIHRMPVVIIAGTCTFVGTSLLYLSQLDSFGKTFEHLSQLPIVASSLFIALWGELLHQLDERRSIMYVTSASLFSFLCVLISIPLGPIGQALFHCLMPAISTLAYVYMLRQSSLIDIARKAVSRSSVNISARNSHSSSTLLRAFLGIGLFGASVVLLQAFSEQKTSAPNEMLWILAGLCVDLCMLVIMLPPKGRVRVSTLSRPVLPLLVAGTFFVFATDFEQRHIEVFVIACAWAYFRLFSWLIWRAGMRLLPIPPISVIAIGQAILTCGTILGNILYSFLMASGTPMFAAMALVCILSVFVATFFLDTRYVGNLADTRPPFDPTDSAACERCVDEATARWGLSDKERSIARLLVQGSDNPSIQNTLVITNNTLRTHLRNLYRKTDTHSREELVVLLRSLNNQE